MNNGGISAIVATVLIILITVAGVAIVWVAIVPMIGENIDFEKSDVRLNIISAEGYTVYDESSGRVLVQIERGVDDEIFYEVEVIISFGGTTFYGRVPAPESNSKVVYSFNISVYVDIYGAPTSVKVAPVLVSGGKERMGMASSDIYFSEGDLSDIESDDDYNLSDGDEVVSTCIDGDGDGFGENCVKGLDCNDEDSLVNPDAEEICGDDIDNDCSDGDEVCIIYEDEVCGDGVCGDNENSVNCRGDCHPDYDMDIYDNFDDWTLYEGEYATSSTLKVSDRKFLVSPVVDVGAGNEQMHHWINVNYSANDGGKVKLILGHSSSDNLDNVMVTYYRTNFERDVDSDEETHVASQYKLERYSWVILEIDDDVTLNSVEHVYWKGIGTAYGHSARTFDFAGSYLPYRILYPNNYDSSKSYPLVLSVTGSGYEGVDNIRQMSMVQYGRRAFENFYYDERFEAFSIVPQIPKTTVSTTQILEGYYPHPGGAGGPTPIYHSTWAAVNENGFYAEASVALIKSMIDDPELNIDSNRIYFTGFSYGGKAAFEFAKEDPDIWAAIWPVAGWSMGGAYQDITTASNADDLLAKLDEEVAIYKDISWRIGAGGLDGMRYSSNLTCGKINDQGGNCIYDEKPNAGHVSSSSMQADRRYVEWLFDQVKS